MGWLLRKPLFWFFLVVVASTALNFQALSHAEDKVEAVAAEEAQTNYENQIASCESGNPVREATWLATSTAARVATRGNDLYAEAAEKITNAPYVRANGSRECRKAIKQP